MKTVKYCMLGSAFMEQFQQ